jgi:hypothetical protein
MKPLFNLLLLVGVLCANSARAGVGSVVVGEGVEIATELFGETAAREAAEITAERAAQEGAEVVLRQAGVALAKDTAEQVAARAGIVAARASGKAAMAVARYGPAASGIVNTFGDDAAGALMSVSARNGRRLLMLEKELAQSGQGESLLRLVSKRGDAVVEWLFSNRGTVAAGVGATVLLTNPDAVLKAASTVTAATLKTVGDDVVRPITEGIMWMIARLALLFGLTAAGSYALWLKVPSMRSTIDSLIKHGMTQIRSLRK